MKKKIILITLLSIFLGSKINVYASTYTDKFIISDVINGIYYAKEKNGTIEYRMAKFKRRVSDNKIVYCIEPFVDMLENTNYKGYDYNYESILKLSPEDWERISLLSYYGYGYPGHTDEKWYPITQILIWKTIDKEASFYYTNTFKGTKITRFVNEEKELETLVKNHSALPSFNKESYNMSISSSLTIKDENNVLSNYEIVNKNDIAKIEGNNLIINSTTEEQEVTIELVKKDKIYTSLPIIYISNTYQNILSVGSYNPISSSINIKIESGSIKITKLDAETKSTITQGEASLFGTTYALYDENNNYIDKIVIGENNIGTLSNIKYGNYKLKEIISGNGYILDNKEYYFNLNAENKNITLELYNEVIKRKIKIKKYIGNEENKTEEENIIFNIYNNNNELVKKVKTNAYGEIELELPYGTYLVKQINTTSGYYKVDDFYIEIDESSDELIEFYLYDLKVPNTYQTNHIYTIYGLFISTTLGLLIIKKYEKNNN